MRKLMLFTAGFASAALLCIFFLPPVCLWAVGGSALLTAAGFLLRGLARSRTVSVCLGLFCGFAWCAAYFLLFLAPLEALTGQTRTFSASAADAPAQTGYGWRVDADLLLPHRRVRTVLYFSEETDILPGDTLSGSAAFSRTAEERIPIGFPTMCFSPEASGEALRSRARSGYRFGIFRRRYRFASVNGYGRFSRRTAWDSLPRSSPATAPGWTTRSATK